MTTLISSINSLAQQAATCHKSIETMQYSQAALNLAQAASIVNSLPKPVPDASDALPPPNKYQSEYLSIIDAMYKEGIPRTVAYDAIKNMEAAKTKSLTVHQITALLDIKYPR